MRTRIAGLFCALSAVFLTPAQTPADTPPRWWKGNLHAHTFWSDGDAFPDMVADWYREHGYHFLALSEHNLLPQGERWIAVAEVNRRAELDAFSRYLARFGPAWVETQGNPGAPSHQVRLKGLDEVRALVEERGRFLMLPAEEITGSSADGRALHMNAINLAEPLPMESASTLRETLVRNYAQVEASAKRTARPVLFQVNHLNYKWGVTAEDLAAVRDVQFFEVWNGVDNDNDPGEAPRPGTGEMWDIANTLRIQRYAARPLFGIATDDAHDYHGNKTRALPGRAWIMVRATHLSPASLLAAIRRGDFYASTGVVINAVDFDRQARTLSLRLEARPGEVLTTQFIGTRRGANLQGRPRRDGNGQPLETTLDYRSPASPPIGEVLAESKETTPHYTLRGDELYVRAVVTSNLPPAVPSRECPVQRAWTQPVGW
ncbi:MAG TPA: hypothetical protein DEH78_17205 [Solibacterales bacterium]|nr:hypothetical protein [Bryobacterales bacterium]